MEELQEQMAGAQKVAWADNAIKLAVEMTVAAIGSLDLTGSKRRAGGSGSRRDSASSSRRQSPWYARPERAFRTDSTVCRRQ